MSKVDANFGPRAREYFKVAKEKGTYITDGNNKAVKSNINALKRDVSPIQGPKSNLKAGQKNILGGKFDMTA